MQTELWTISKIFTENLFRIPDYQRGYAWGDRQLQDFWNDIELLEAGKNHYTGVITLEDVPKMKFETWEDDLWIINSKRYRPYYVVDGQQRLTTIVILIYCILSRIVNNERLNYFTQEEIRKKFVYDCRGDSIFRSYMFGYEKDNPSYEFLKTRIFEEQSESHSIGEQTIYTKNLENAKTFFTNKLGSASMAEVESIFTKVTQCFLFNIYVISDDIDVFIAFETMNNRGKPLSHLELLKNRLVFLSTKIHSNNDEKQRLRRTVNESWKTAYHFIGKSAETPLLDNSFLFIQSLLYFKRIKKINEEISQGIDISFRRIGDESYKDFLLDTYFTTKNIKIPHSRSGGFLDARNLHDYVLDVKSKVEIFVNVVSPGATHYSEEEKVYLTRIGRLAGGWPSMLLLVAIYSAPCKEEKVTLLNLIEKMLFLRAIKTSYSRATEFPFEEQSLSICNDRKAVSALSDFIEKHIQLVMNEIDFRQSLADVAKSVDQYYGWRPLKYILFEYEQSLLRQSKTKREKLNWEEFRKEDYNADYATIEHIYPKTVKDKCWKEPFEKYTLPQRNALRNSLGNLLPLSKVKNSSLRNACFLKKKGDDGNKVGYSYGCYSEIEVSHCSKWEAREIADRGLRMLKFIEENWSLDFGDKTSKLELLGLGFLKAEDIP